MNKTQVLALYKEELVKAQASPALEEGHRDRLLSAIDAERPRLVEAVGRNQDMAGLMAAKSALAQLDAKREKLVAQTSSTRTSESMALAGTRTRIHEALQLAKPAPDAGDLEDAEDHHHRQKSHGKALWAEVDRFVKEAGLAT